MVGWDSTKLELAGEQLRIVNVYGWTGAHTDRHARKRTANLFNIIKAELEAQSAAATFIMGDFNGDLADFPVLAKLIEEEGWNDLGAIADQLGPASVCTDLLAKRR